MTIKALIIDLDNTIFPVPSIGEELFRPFFHVLEESGEFKGDLKDIKQDMMRIPFQKVAQKYKFSEQLKQQGDKLLQTLKYEKPIPPFEDYAELRALPQQKFLVTTGYTNMQQSKVEKLGIKDDFEEVHIVDPSKSDLTKKDIFQSIVERYKYDTSEVLVVGDDPESELKAGRELGLGTVLYAKDSAAHSNVSPRITHFGQLKEFLT
ncbi:HAD family hydrolase [Pontibacter kalidii]|uniref:HAD family hydrolase n=1 Tax=Pontibacter kalidii TaxID=2592049 RepID=UPI00225326C9|nr:HAD family hydrolase [Pontibacter kalidii]